MIDHLTDTNFFPKFLRERLLSRSLLKVLKTRLIQPFTLSVCKAQKALMKSKSSKNISRAFQSIIKRPTFQNEQSRLLISIPIHTVCYYLMHKSPLFVSNTI